ncbi:MAG: PhnD/SsuA/transferrin family substrate-binding protein [Planctomycetota bacterium]
MYKRLVGCLVLFALCTSSVTLGEDAASISMVVMDPLAAPLSCPCVEGYAQRDYEALASHLESAVGCPVQVAFAESLLSALEKTDGRADIVIGKQSVVAADMLSTKLKAKPMFRLTDKSGSTEQYGMIVVGKDDPAKEVSDLEGYTIIFGPAEAEEKSGAAMALLQSAGIVIPKQLHKIDEACSDGACKVIELGPKSRTAAVISSYAQPLLEGCGTIKKGDLRVVAKTNPVPFVTLFVSDSLEPKRREMVTDSLSTVSESPEVLEALESLVGFLPVSETSKKK